LTESHRQKDCMFHNAKCQCQFMQLPLLHFLLLSVFLSFSPSLAATLFLKPFLAVHQPLRVLLGHLPDDAPSGPGTVVKVTPLLHFRLR
jgi:hypothetical protein